MAQVVDLAAFRRRKAATSGVPGASADTPARRPTGLTDAPRELYDRVVWQNWILLTVLAQCVWLGREAGARDVRVPTLTRAGVLSAAEARTLETAIRRHLDTNRPLPRTRRLAFLALSRRLERRIQRQRRQRAAPTGVPA
jgi:hypothetical protein